jgi:hypothetical protein
MLTLHSWHISQQLFLLGSSHKRLRGKHHSLPHKVNQMYFRTIADYLIDVRSCFNAKLREHLSKDNAYSNESTLPPSTPTYPPARGMTGTHATLGIICAIIGLFVFPEIFCSAAIILGAITWKRESGNRGLYIVIFGIICMLVGLYLTAYIILQDLFPS